MGKGEEEDTWFLLLFGFGHVTDRPIKLKPQDGRFDSSSLPHSSFSSPTQEVLSWGKKNYPKELLLRFFLFLNSVHLI